MGQSPKISIVLPTYNGSRYLEQSLESCLTQTYADWELIVVDDCSTDGTPEILDRYAKRDARIRVHRNATNQRLPKSLNIGFAQARGEYLTWTSDDNRYQPRALEVLLRELEADRAVDLVYSDYAVIDDQGETKSVYRVDEPENLWAGNCVGACFLYRRAVHERLGGYAEDLFLMEDYDFWLRAYAQFRMKPIHQTLYDYRYHEKSLTTQQAHRTARLADDVLARNLKSLSQMSERGRIEAALRLCKGGARRGELARVIASASYAWSISPRLLMTAAIEKVGRGIKK